MKKSLHIRKMVMMNLILLILALSSSLEAKQKSAVSPASNTFKARITFYYPNEDQSGFVSAKGDKLIPWKSAAVCFRTIPYGSTIDVPGIGTLIAQDTGSAVISRKAARLQGQNVPVIDVCVKNRSDMLRMQSEFPMFVDVKIDKAT